MRRLVKKSELENLKSLDIVLFNHVSTRRVKRQIFSAR